MGENPLPNSLVLPGQRLCELADTYKCGVGTYEHQGFIHSSLAGHLSVKRCEHEPESEPLPNSNGSTSHAPDPPKKNGTVTLEVSVHRKNRSIVPSVGSVVIARITAITSRFAKCAVISVDNVMMPDSFKGLLRKEDVRATEKDKVEIHKSFQPSDIIVAKVLSLGDAHSYLLTTAENELGVVVSYSDEGEVMVPVSWCEMQCPKTMTKGLRKVAKPQPQFLDVVG